MNKADKNNEAFKLKVNDFLWSIGAIAHPQREDYKLLLTKCGLLEIRGFGDEPYCLYSAFTQYPELASKETDCNSYNGKWNHHFPAELTPNEAAEEIRKAYRKLLPDVHQTRLAEVYQAVLESLKGISEIQDLNISFDHSFAEDVASWRLEFLAGKHFTAVSGFPAANGLPDEIAVNLQNSLWEKNEALYVDHDEISWYLGTNKDASSEWLGYQILEAVEKCRQGLDQLARKIS